MEDFTSAAMMRVVKAGLTRQGLSQSPAPAAKGARYPIRSKRALLSEVLADHGPLAILKIGEAIETMPSEPALIALGAARDPLDLMDRWTRLERFVHSEHRVRQEKADNGRVHLRHISIKEGKSPRAEEDLLVLGIIVGLAAFIGTIDLRVRFQGCAPWAYDRGWREAPALENSAAWELVWSGVEPRAETLLDEAEPVAKLRRLVQADLARRWTIAEAARALALSTRSLQRCLRDQGTTYSQIVADIRVAAAAELLQFSPASFGEIGFACGFADQAHFTRSFKASTSTTPRVFRLSFAKTDQPTRPFGHRMGLSAG